MGFDLSGVSKDGKEGFRFNSMAWPRVLMLALEHCWSPKGTSDPITYHALDPDYEPDDWDPMCYETNDGQFVEWEDAALLAKAIEKAVISEECRVRASEDIVEAVGHGERPEAGEICAKDRRYLLDFVEFCRETQGFRIF